MSHRNINILHIQPIQFQQEAQAAASRHHGLIKAIKNTVHDFLAAVVASRHVRRRINDTFPVPRVDHSIELIIRVRRHTRHH
mmetsp:Transcript_13251/g.20808  ORF Transcript_13251/g.20808 Transcript_13251/m.20808 type:complete len:82 (-) Transcript_13251:1248-1493(-)